MGPADSGDVIYMRICIRAQYPATGQYDWWEALKALHPVTDIELAFHSPDSFVSFVNPGEVILAIKTQGLSVPTIHMAHANLSNLSLFMRVFTGTLKIAQALHCTEIIVHPSYGSAPDLDAIFDGILLPLLEDPSASLARDTLYWHYPLAKPHFLGGRSCGAIRKGNWKLLEFFDDGHVELYNVKDDIGEKNNLADKMPRKTRELHGLLQQWHKWLENANARCL